MATSRVTGYAVARNLQDAVIVSVLAYMYGSGAPLIFPLGAVFQTTSVYFCVAAAVDCFISVVLPQAFKDICCTAK